MKKNECKCDGCKNACKYRPGWFLPNQVDDLLKYFNVKTIEELLNTGKIAIDWWIDDDENVMVLAPNVKGNEEIYYHKKYNNLWDQQDNIFLYYLLNLEPIPLFLCLRSTNQ